MVRLYWEAEAIRPPFYFRWFLKPYSPDFFGEVIENYLMKKFIDQ